jgi:hypothetical protein
MVDMSAIAGALAALKGANDIAQAMIGLRDAAAFQTKLIEFQAKIIEANNSAFAAQDERAALLQKIGDLEKEMAALKAERRKFDRYKLKDYGGGTYAYELKESEANGEPIHRVCAHCYQQGHISILNFAHKGDGGVDWYNCHRCNDARRFGVADHTNPRPPLRHDYF